MFSVTRHRIIEFRAHATVTNPTAGSLSVRYFCSKHGQELWAVHTRPLVEAFLSEEVVTTLCVANFVTALDRVLTPSNGGWPKGPLKRGPTNPGNHQTVVSSVGERTSNGCQRRFDGDVGFGCSRNAPPTALERRSRWNAGIKVCDMVRTRHCWSTCRPLPIFHRPFGSSPQLSLWR
ncbi:hypothetical protein FA13DRAFT_506488 [Coprinellus micaceus]|uniref:Uncharacterized protein n=1 Tax=Coprinellus micaceus TaxID=71717 RepID=A0A4Y7SC83_COPMI|nr:hypothetical protein FA13DRAFT_506488 [Coprinellus micaceus]